MSALCPPYAPFFGFAGVSAAMIFSTVGAAIGTSKAGIGIAGLGTFKPELIMKSLIPVVMSGIIAVYGLVVSVLIAGSLKPDDYTLSTGFTHLGAGLACGLTGLSAGYAIGYVGDSCVRAFLYESKVFVSMVLILIFAEVLGLYGPNPARLVSESTLSKNQAAANREYNPKKRYLLVYHDAGKGLHHFNTLGEIFRVLEDIIYGNIIVMESGRAVLSDLEYAREFVSGPPFASGPKTGTPYFMAYELLAEKWVLLELTSNAKYNRQNRFKPKNERQSPENLDPLPPASTIIYNFQYDLESVLWIALWFMLDCVECISSQVYATQIFQNGFGSIHNERSVLFTQRGHLVKKLRQHLHSELLNPIGPMEQGREDLLQTYLEREKGDQVRDPASYTEIYCLMLTVMDDCQTVCRTKPDLPTLSLASRRSDARISKSQRPSPSPSHPASPMAQVTSSKRSASPHDDARSDDQGRESPTKRSRMEYMGVDKLPGRFLYHPRV
ncbi:V-type proton ATPase 16 kDa proteolipid subunit 2 [Leucoagaricus sp. SymC.cos]|nr:V-type proton ATPase 16 kDa proteolipid subunit 2 [Leucoagaricus sp. SymC.cos]